MYSEPVQATAEACDGEAGMTDAGCGSYIKQYASCARLQSHIKAAIDLLVGCSSNSSMTTVYSVSLVLDVFNWL